MFNSHCEERRGCLKREADVFLTKFNFIKRRLLFRKLLKFPKHGSRNNIKYGYKKTVIPFETAS